MKLQKLLAAICCAGLMTSLLSGCNSSGGITVNQGGSGASGEQQNTAGEVTEITFCNWGDSEEKKVFESVFDAFEEKNKDIKVNYLFIPQGEYMTKLSAMAATNSLPDAGQMLEANALQWAEDDMFVDVSNLYESGEITKRLDSVTFDETKSGSLGASFITECYVLFYDKDYCDSMGVTVPAKVEDAWTWDEFVAACKKLTVDTNGNHPDDPGFDPANIKVYGISDMPAEMLAVNNGGGYFNEDCTEIWLDKPETIEAIQMVADLMNVHHVAPTPASRGAIGGGNNVLLTGKVAMSYAGQYNLLWYKQYIESGVLNLGFGVGPELKEYSVLTSGPSIVVFKSSQHQEEALRLLEYFYDTENLMPAIQSGLWMPSEEAYFTDEAKIQEWVSGGSYYNEDYRTAVIDVCHNNAVGNNFYHMSNYSTAYDLINSPLDQVWSGKKSAEEVIKNEIMPNLTKEMDRAKS